MPSCSPCILEEAVRVKRLSTKRAAVRDLLSNVIADYNRGTVNKEGFDMFLCFFIVAVFGSTN